MVNKIFNQLKSLLRKIPDFIKLYLVQIFIYVILWGLNQFLFKEVAVEVIYNVSKNLDPILVYTEPWYEIFWKTFLSLFIIYLLIIIIGHLTKFWVGYVLYLILVFGIALSAGETFGGGIFSYAWGLSLKVVILGQLEWLSGSILVTTTRSDDKVSHFMIGVGMLVLVALFSSIIFL